MSNTEELFSAQATMNDVKCLISVAIAALDRVEDGITGTTQDDRAAHETLHGAWTILHDCYNRLDNELAGGSMSANCE